MTKKSYATEMHDLAVNSEDVKTAVSYTTNKYDRVRQHIKKESLRGQTSGTLVEIGKSLGGSPYHTPTLIRLLGEDGFIVVDSTGAGTHAVFWPGEEETEKHFAALAEIATADKKMESAAAKKKKP